MRQLKIAVTFTNRESASLDKYLLEIGKLPLLTSQEEIELAQKIREGDELALERLITANLRFVVSVAKQYQNRGMTLPDLINEGNFGLIKAAKKFDETKGFKFISYAVWSIRQSIIQAIDENSRVVRLPGNKIGKLNKIRKEISVIEQNLEREATVNEIANVLDIAEEEVKFLLSISGKQVSTDANIMENENMSLIELLENHDALQPDCNLMNNSLNTEIQRLLSKLSEREIDVVTLFYGIGFNQEFTIKEIGKKCDLTCPKVRQVKNQALRRLKHVARSKSLGSYL